MILRKKISISLDEEIIQIIDSEAIRNGSTRQSVLEVIICLKVNELPEADHYDAQIFPKDILEIAQKEAAQIPAGRHVTLKKLLHQEWSQFSDYKKRSYGKLFKKEVEKGNIYRMSIGPKKSNNEQQYKMN